MSENRRKHIKMSEKIKTGQKLLKAEKNLLNERKRMKTDENV